MKDLDKVLHSAFTPLACPSPQLNNSILRYSKEERETIMKKLPLKKALITVCLVLACAVPVYAAVQLLSPSDVAVKKGDLALSAAFKSPDAVYINETQTDGGYNITLLGTVSGNDISDEIIVSDGQIQKDCTYCVVAIANSDGTPFASNMDFPRMFVSPYIKGYEPQIINIISLNGGYFDTLVDGVMYRIIRCDNIEPFADQQIVLGVSDGVFYNSKAFNYNMQHGTMSPNSDYDGVNVLFDLLLNPNKADSDKAAEIIMDILG